jgi:hypothetical protein
MTDITKEGGNGLTEVQKNGLKKMPNDEGGNE